MIVISGLWAPSRLERKEIRPRIIRYLAKHYHEQVQPTDFKDDCALLNHVMDLAVRTKRLN